MSRCSFDIHVQEILGTLMIGATVVMLHPQRKYRFDVSLLTHLCKINKLVIWHSVPTLLQSISSFYQKTDSTILFYADIFDHFALGGK